MHILFHKNQMSGFEGNFFLFQTCMLYIGEEKYRITIMRDVIGSQIWLENKNKSTHFGGTTSEYLLIPSQHIFQTIVFILRI